MAERDEHQPAPQEETGKRERHEESMARGLALQADFIASVRTALGHRAAEFTDRQIWQEIRPSEGERA